MSRYPKKVGLIAEDESDIESLKELLKKVVKQENIGFKSFVGRGCGKIKRKVDDWAKQLKLRGCKVLILVHDLDRNNHETLFKSIRDSIEPFIIADTFISIPVEEMEAWFLADPNAIKIALKLQKNIKTYHHPERVRSPKEVLGMEIEKASKNSKIYINTKHNPLISKQVDIELLKSKCDSFNQLCEFAAKKI